MWEILIALGVVVALAADALTILDILAGWWRKNKHDESDGGGE